MLLNFIFMHHLLHIYIYVYIYIYTNKKVNATTMTRHGTFGVDGAEILMHNQAMNGASGWNDLN